MDEIVSSEDIEVAIKNSESKFTHPNKKIIETIPHIFKLDGKEIFGNPEEMQGSKLEVQTLSLTSLNQHIDNLADAVLSAGVDLINIIPSPLATQRVVLSQKQKEAGCMLLDIGAETVTLSVFEDGKLLSLHVFRIGSTDITNDIALGLKVSLEDAEYIKIGSMFTNFPKKKLDDIIEARLSDIFELVSDHLKKIKRYGLLPAGVILTGGGSNLPGIAEMVKKELGLPTQTAKMQHFTNLKTRLDEATWFTALGLCLASKEPSHRWTGGREGIGFSKNLKSMLKSFGKQLLP